VEAVGPPRDQADADVDGLDQCVGQPVVEDCDESIDVADDAVGDGDEGQETLFCAAARLSLAPSHRVNS
jgi:hypothetical protein